MIWHNNPQLGRTRCATPQIILRIPGNWANLAALQSRMQGPFEMREGRLVLPSGRVVELRLREADHQFPAVFRSATSRELTDDEFQSLCSATQHAIVSAAAGTLEAARQMFTVGMAVIDAGGLGVFLDTGARSHPARTWRELHELRDDPATLAFAFATIVLGKTCLFSTGMHVLGHRDVQLAPTADPNEDFEDLASFMIYLVETRRKVEEGHFVGGPEGRYFYEVHGKRDRRVEALHPMYNPYGIWDMKPLVSTPIPSYPDQSA